MKHASVLQSCTDAIEEVFDSKLHIIGGVGITIGVIMVSECGRFKSNSSDSTSCCLEGPSYYKQVLLIALPFPGVRDDLQHAPVLRHQEVSGGGVTPAITPPEIYINVA